MCNGQFPLKDVFKTLNSELILRKIKTLHASLLRDFGINKPKMPVLS